MQTPRYIKPFRIYIDEDVAAVSTGAGMAGLGGDPPGRKQVMGPIQRRRVRQIHPRPVKRISEENSDGALTLTIPVLIRALEIAREVLKSDDELHIFVEKIMDLNVKGPIQMTDIAKVYSQYKD